MGDIAILRTIAAALLLAGSGRALAQADDTQLWITETVATALTPETNIGLDVSERFREARIGDDQYLFRVSVDQRIAKGVEIGGGFTLQAAGRQNEYRPHAQILLTQGPLLLRSRLEPRIIDGVDGTGVRLRERLQLLLPLGARSAWTLVASGEGFFQLNRVSNAKFTGLNLVRTQIGLRRTLSRLLTLTLIYQRQQTIVPGGADTVNHAPVLTLAARL